MLAGLREVTEVTARWGEGIGRNSHTLELQELGGFWGPPFSTSPSLCTESVAKLTMSRNDIEDRYVRLVFS